MICANNSQCNVWFRDIACNTTAPFSATFSHWKPSHISCHGGSLCTFMHQANRCCYCVEFCHISLYMIVYGYGSIPIDTIFSGMNIHLPAILRFTRGTRFWPIPICLYICSGWLNISASGSKEKALRGLRGRAWRNVSAPDSELRVTFLGGQKWGPTGARRKLVYIYMVPPYVPTKLWF